MQGIKIYINKKVMLQRNNYFCYVPVICIARLEEGFNEL